MAHQTTQSAFEALSAREQAFWEGGKQYFFPYRDKGSLGETDWYNTHTAMSRPERYRQVAPYAYEILGQSFHNFPIELETSETDGSWQTNTEKTWRWVMQGFDYYVPAVVRCLKIDQFKDACGFLGWLFHVLQDQAGFLHALQGPAGVQPFIFSEFFAAPPDRPHLAPTALLSEGCPPVSLGEYQPLLLGTSLGEATFHLYQRYRQANRYSRQHLIPLIEAMYAHDKDRETEIREEIATRIAEVLADLWHTVYCLARAAFPEDEAAALDEVDMTDLFPVEYPNHLGGCYGMTPIVKSFCLGLDRKPVPLRLALEEDGTSEVVTFDTGLGTGAHYQYILSYGIPAGVYDRVSLAVGLHAELARQGHVEVNIRLNEQILLRREFRGASGLRFSADVSRGGILRWIVRSLTSFHDPNNHVVWGEPVLRKPGG